MDKATLVDDRIAEARKLVDCLSREGRLDVSAAYWMQSLDDGRWSLNIVSPTIDTNGWNKVGIALLATVDHHPEIHVDRDEVWLRDPDTPVIAEVVDLLRRYPASEAFRLGGVYLRGRFLERAYICPVKLDE